MASEAGNLAQDCKAFYEKRLRLTSSVSSKWKSSLPSPSVASSGGLSSSSSNPDDHFSKLPSQIAQLRTELLSLAHLDNELFKNLLALNDKLEELKLQRSTQLEASQSHLSDEASESQTTEEYDDDDIDEEVDQDEEAFYSSLPPAQILEQASHVQSGGASEASSAASANASSHGGLDVIGGLKFMLRSRSFLLRPPFHKKSNTLSRSTPRRSRINAESSSPFRTFDRIQENRVADDFVNRNALSASGKGAAGNLLRSQSAERQQQKKKTSSSANESSSTWLTSGSSATLTRGFHLPHTSKSLWQRVFVGGGSGGGGGLSSSSHANNNSLASGPESLPCSWRIIDMDDKSPPPTLKHIKQNSFDSGIHHSDSSEYSIKV